MNNDKETSKISRRRFLQITGGGLGVAAIGTGTCHYLGQEDVKGKIVIIGGGAAGCSIAARLMRKISNPDITLIDPSDRQYYQPGFTFIASGIWTANDVWKPQETCIPNGVKWVKDSVVAVDPVKQNVRTAKGENIPYDFMVLCPGLKLCWNEVEGISRETLGQGNAHSVYDFEGAQRIWPAIQKLAEKGGRGVFTDTYTKSKCGGAPKKICMLTEHLCRKKNNRENVQINYFCSEKALYDVPHYTPRLLQIYEERNILLDVNCRVKGVDTAAKKVYMERHEKMKVMQTDPETGLQAEVEEKKITPFVEDYDLLSFVPPQCAPDFVRESGLGWTEGKLASGAWAMVDKDTLQHKTYPNIVSLGDCAGIPTSKTSSAIREQLPIAVDNLIEIMKGQEPTHKYNGYACCPIVTDYGHVLFCEFDYEKKADITFPFSLLDMSKEQSAAWLLKRHFLKPMFFYGMIPGLV